jgi:hypothetical protein
MTPQDLLDPKSWAERPFGGVQLHDRRRTRRAVKAESRLGGESFGFLACSNAHVERDQSVVSVAGGARCHLCGLDTASHSTDQRTSHFLCRGAVGARYDRYRSVSSSQDQLGSDKSATNADGGFSCKRCWPCGRETREVMGCLAKATLCAHSRSRWRTASSTAQARGTRNRRLEAPGAGHWHTGVGKHVGPCRRWGGGDVPLLQKRASRRRRPFWCERGSHGACRRARKRSAIL